MKFKTLIFRIIFIILGIILIGVAVGMFQTVNLGNDPFSCMNTGISRAIGVKFWIEQLCVNIICFIPTILFYRNAIGFGTIFNMVFVGVFADISRPLLEKYLALYLNLPVRIIVMCIAVVLMCIGVAFYAACDMGLAPYDALSYILEKFTGKSFSIFRIITDIICVIIGFLFGLKTGIEFKIVGIGTIVTAFGTGPVVKFFQTFVAVPVLKKCGYESKINSGGKENK